MSEELKDFLTIDDFDVEGKTVLFRGDLNSLVINGRVQMKERIEENAKTIRELSERKAKVVVLALRNLVDLKYVDDIIGPAAREGIKKMTNGDVLLLDNVRILAEETLDRTPEEHAQSMFVTRLAPLADIYINDAFSVAHRSHASVVALESGVDSILTAGKIGDLFLYAKGEIPLKVDKDLLESVDRARRIAEQGGRRIKYPWDVAVEMDGKRKEIPLEEVKPNEAIYDIGEKTCEKYGEIIKNARTVIMKGPVGAFEREGFAKGTKEIFKAISDSDAFSLLGGGHTSAAISEVGMNKKEIGHFHISLAGGAFLRYLLGKPLPGIEVLKKH
jgi:phosphoglycerate kinase